MDFELPEELVALRDSARRFATERVAPHAQEWDRKEGFPDEMIRALGDQGFMGIMVPEEYGGSGGDHMAFGVILEELARRDGGLALAVEAHNGLCCAHLMHGANDEQKRRFLPALARGEQIGSWCLTEPGSGTDAAAMSTRAVRDGDHWIIDGSKQFITNGSRAGVFIVMANTDPGKGPKGITAFAVEADAPGLHIGPREEKLGMRSSDTVPLRFENMRVPDANRLGGVNEGFKTVKKVLEAGRIMVSAISLGLARGAIEDSVKYAGERAAFGKAILEFQLIQAKIADMASGLEAARLLVWRAATMHDAGRSTAYEAPVAKVFASEMATRVCMEAIQVHGGYGYLRDYNVERHMRDAKLCEIGEGTSEILRVLIARQAAIRFGA